VGGGGLGRGKYFRGERKSSDFWEILGERGGGLPMWAREREEIVYNDIELCPLTPFWTFKAEKRSKKSFNYSLGYFFGPFYLLLVFFAIFALFRKILEIFVFFVRPKT
jgi:hypothetical protein